MLLLLFLLTFSSTAYNQQTDLRQTITLPSYLLRDRAIVLDSLVMKKLMYVSFKSSLPLSRIRGGAAWGTLSHKEEILAHDTTYLFDEAAGNLGFSLPYHIPDGMYHLEIQMANSAGKLLDTFSGDFERDELMPYFNRYIQFWDFTMPYAHLDCRGYGNITYHFNSKKYVSGLQSLEISARMTTGNDKPGLIEVQLNGISLGDFNLPGGKATPALVNWQVKNDDILSGLSIQKGDNQLGFVLKAGTGSSTGLRIYSTRNSSGAGIEEAVPIILNVNSGLTSKQTDFTLPVWGEEGEHISSKLSVPPPKYFTRQLPGQEQPALPLNNIDVQKGYVVFSRNFQRYVYNWTIPVEEERVKSMDIVMGQNDFEPLTLSIYPIRDLGDVKNFCQ